MKGDKDVDEIPLNVTALISKTTKNINLYRALTLLRAGVLFLLLKYRFCNPLEDAFVIWVLTVFCECLFVLNFLMYSILKWRPVERVTYPDRLSARYEKRGEACKLYPVDIFVTTADPQKESPLITANTILSVLAVDYPVDRVSCYVSDDSASPITFCMMLEVSMFAQKWVPFCKKFSIKTPAPAVFLSSDTDSSLPTQWKDMKEEFEQLQNRINDLAKRPEEALKIARQYRSWPCDNPNDHPCIVEVVNNTGFEGCKSNIPLLVYVAREKRQGYNPQFKAGALNALMRVSGVLSNSPILLNLDCDMYINDSKALRHAMCVFMDTNTGRNVAFVQFPQVFNNLVRQNIYGNRLVFLYDVLLKGLDGIQGPFYCGTGCFLRRTALYGVECQEECKSKLVGSSGFTGVECQAESLEECRSKLVGSSLAVFEQVKADTCCTSVEDLCRCNYEQSTAWGKQVGWRYGCSTEDVLTGYELQCLGWRSIYLWPSPPAFKGVAPSTASDRLTQRKRIAAGLVSILFRPSSPLLYAQNNRLMFLQRVAYIYNCMFYAGISVFVMLYAVLHAASLLSAISLTPKITEHESMWFVGAICLHHGMSFLEYRWGAQGGTGRFGIKEWWNEERFWFVSNVSCFVLGTLEALLNSIGLVESAFTVTPKNSNGSERETPYEITASPLFVPPVTLVLLFLLAIMSVMRRGVQAVENMGGELLFGMWSLFILYPIVVRVAKGLRTLPGAVMLPSLVATTVLYVITRFWF